MRKEDTPSRIIKRRYEEKHKDERKKQNKVWGTSLDRALSDEIDKFLIQHNLTKVELIMKGYEALIKEHELEK